MKKNVSLIVAALTVAALCFISCEHEGDNNGDNMILDAVEDVDGNKYDAVRIGDQVWMQSNLRTKHFRDGSPVPQGNQGDYSFTDPYCYQPTAQEMPKYNEKKFGLYYNWSAVSDVRGLCPDGWHVPSDMEWSKLGEYVGSKPEYVYGADNKNIAKALASQVGWNLSSVEGTPGNNSEANNATGFSAFSAGYYSGTYSSYGLVGNNASFWSSDESDSYNAYGLDLYYNNTGVMSFIDGKDHGFSVRCVRD